MTKRTDREFHIALGKLLDRVRVQNEWNAVSFIRAASHVKNVSKAEAARFYKALTDLNLLIPGTDKRRLTPNFDILIWRNEDRRIGFVREILEMYPNIIQKKGPVKGTHYSKRTVSHVEEEVEIAPIEVIQEEIVNPLAYFSPQDLVAELRDRGFTVTCAREIITVETL